jgi:Ca-activated chloride channel family protein
MAVAACGGSYAPGAGAPRQPSYAVLAAGAPVPAAEREPNTESYDRVYDNSFLDVASNPLSTFSIDVDTASYSNVRRFLSEGKLPPKDAVRIEELLNYFPYRYREPTDGAPFSADTEVSEAPWKPEHRLVHIGLQARHLKRSELPPRNLVFLIDVSGSMADENKLPLLRQSLKELVGELNERDRVAIAVYAGASGLVLPCTPAAERAKILSAIDDLQAGGSTNGGEGIVLAYRVAREGFLSNGVNRVILATDGDFNVGVTGQGDLVRLIEKERDSGVFLTVLGFGMGNYKDSTLEKLADKGNGSYAYIDTISEARKSLVHEGGAALVPIAKDVKIQVEFNPRQVSAYRLIGYENRLLAAHDFNDDRKDAGDMGAGNSVTALYEVVPAGARTPTIAVDALKYQKPAPLRAAAEGNELFTIKLRYKRPDADRSALFSFPVRDGTKKLAETSETFRFSAAVAAFGMLLRGTEHKGQANFGLVESLAKDALGDDRQGYRAEFLGLVQKARQIE